jgi:hypothetical protein
MVYILVLIKRSISYRTDLLQRILNSWRFPELARVHMYWHKYCAGTIDCPVAMLPCL